MISVGIDTKRPAYGSMPRRRCRPLHRVLHGHAYVSADLKSSSPKRGAVCTSPAVLGGTKSLGTVCVAGRSRSCRERRALARGRPTTEPFTFTRSARPRPASRSTTARQHQRLVTVRGRDVRHVRPTASPRWRARPRRGGPPRTTHRPRPWREAHDTDGSTRSLVALGHLVEESARASALAKGTTL